MNNNTYSKDAKRYGVSSLQATSVIIAKKDLVSIPSFIFHMPNLRNLILEDNNLTTVSDDIGKLTNLKTLCLVRNKLTSIPASIGKLTKLEKLFIGHNRLTSVPETIGFLSLLRVLSLHHNKLITVPVSIGNLEGLHELSLNDNMLTRLPETIGNIEGLVNLDVNDNQLTALPTSIKKCKRLEDLSVSGNKLTALPENIGDLKSLEVLHAANNKLSRLPESIGKLKNMYHLELSGNPLERVPESMKNIRPFVRIFYGNMMYNVYDFMKMFVVNRPVRTNADRVFRVNNSTNVMNRSFMGTYLSNVAPNKRAFINNKANVKSNGTLRRIYDINGIEGYMLGRMVGLLHGATFGHKNITLLKNVPHAVSKTAYLRNIKSRLTNSTVNNMSGTIKAVKDRLPTNITKTDVNRLAKNVVQNKVRNTPMSNRNRVINTFRSKGLITNEDARRLGKQPVEK